MDSQNSQGGQIVYVVRSLPKGEILGLDTPGDNQEGISVQMRTLAGSVVDVESGIVKNTADLKVDLVH